MANQACDNFVYCPPCADGTPWRNFSSEVPDPADFFRFVFVQELPNFNALNDWWAGTAIPAGCHAPTVQAAEDCARRLGENEIVGGWRDGLGIPTPLYGNAAQTCQVDCAVGLPFTYTVPAGTVVARTQAEADALAASYCLFRALQERVCGPLAITLDATNITGSSATLKGTVNPNDAITAYYFEWGATTSYGHTTTPQTLAAGSDTVSVSANITGFGQTVHFRVVAVNNNGRSVGLDKTFESPVLPPLLWWAMEEGVADPATDNSDRIDVINGLHLHHGAPPYRVSRQTGKVAFGIQLTASNTLGNPNEFTFAQRTGVTPAYAGTGSVETTFWLKIPTLTKSKFGIIGLIGGALLDMVYDNVADAVHTLIEGSVTTLSIVLNPADNTWHFYRLFIDSTAMTIGVQIDNGAIQTTPAVLGDIPVVGPSGAISLTLEGKGSPQVSTATMIVDELAFWDRKLTADEVTALYNSGNGTTWPLT